MSRRSLTTLLSFACASALLLLPASASAEVQTLKFKYGPVLIKPGQNTIEFEPNRLKPPVPGWITSFKPDLTYTDGEIPRVDVIHLHHGVWLKGFQPLFAAGEEKTIVSAPSGYGWKYSPDDGWIMNHMIHNLTPTPTEVYITYELGFIAADAPEAEGIKEVRTQWFDVMGLSGYPVFDALRGQGNRGRYQYPSDNRRLRAQNYARNRYTMEEDGTLVGTAGHLHPGGLWTELTLTRDGRTVRLFRSEAKYYEPAGAVSWDVSMTATPANWRVGVRKGDVITVSATYDTSKASWYEVMGIMPAAFAPGDTSGVDPFETKVDDPGQVTHGPLAENRNHGGGEFGLPDPRRVLGTARPRGGKIRIWDFLFGQGDLNRTGSPGRIPTIRPGQTLTFDNRDSGKEIWHTVTACKTPCNRETGIAYPLADGPVTFDSGELGIDSRFATAAKQSTQWSTPANLRPGTYAYFCRVHPFMRGAFRVKGNASRR